MLEYTALTMLIISLDHDTELFLYIEEMYAEPRPHICFPLSHRLYRFAIGQLSHVPGLGDDLLCLSLIED